MAKRPHSSLVLDGPERAPGRKVPVLGRSAPIEAGDGALFVGEPGTSIATTNSMDRARPARRAEEEDMPVGDFCRREPCTATADESIREAAKRMDARGVGCLVVVDAGGRPVGMLTDRDLVMRGLRRRRDPDTTTVGEVMHGDVTRVREAAPLEVAIRRMRSRQRLRLRIVPAGSSGISRE